MKLPYNSHLRLKIEILSVMSYINYLNTKLHL